MVYESQEDECINIRQSIQLFALNVFALLIFENFVPSIIQIKMNCGTIMLFLLWNIAVKLNRLNYYSSVVIVIHSPVIIAIFLRTPILKSICKRLLLSGLSIVFCSFFME